MITAEHIAVVVGAVLAALLQLIVAPYLGLFGAVPNFLLAYVMAVSVVRPQSRGVLMPFLLGLLFDFASGGTIGAMAFCLTAVSALVTRIFSRIDNDSKFMAFALMALGVLLVEVLYGAFLIVGGYSASVLEALVFRAAPCFLYDFVIAMILYPLVARFAKPASAVRAELTQLR